MDGSIERGRARFSAVLIAYLVFSFLAVSIYIAPPFFFVGHAEEPPKDLLGLEISITLILVFLGLGVIALISWLSPQSRWHIIYIGVLSLLVGLLLSSLYNFLLSSFTENPLTRDYALCQATGGLGVGYLSVAGIILYALRRKKAGLDEGGITDKSIERIQTCFNAVVAVYLLFSFFAVSIYIAPPFLLVGYAEEPPRDFLGAAIGITLILFILGLGVITRFQMQSIRSKKNIIYIGVLFLLVGLLLSSLYNFLLSSFTENPLTRDYALCQATGGLGVGYLSMAGIILCALRRKAGHGRVKTRRTGTT